MFPKYFARPSRGALAGAVVSITLFGFVAWVATQEPEATTRYRPPSTVERAAAYPEELSEGLAESDLTSAEAGCVEAGIWSTWTPEELAEKNWPTRVSFSGAADLEFSGLPVPSDGGESALYDIFSECEVDLRGRAIAAVGQDAEASRRCVVSSATPEALLDYWQSRFEGGGSSSAYALRVKSQCHRSYDELLDDSPASYIPSPESSFSTESGDSFCGEQVDLIWEMYREGELSAADFDIQMQEIEDSCVGF